MPGEDGALLTAITHSPALASRVLVDLARYDEAATAVASVSAGEKRPCSKRSRMIGSSAPLSHINCIAWSLL